MNTRLFIENREIELDETVQFAITKQFEDLSNPTAIINDWSKTVSIPFTANNNAIFGHIYNPDKLTVEGGSNQELTGIYFNPYKKLDMRLQYGDNVLMVGYAKMNEVKQSNSKGTYEITLFGELGKVFQEMQKITFDTTTNDTDYLIHGEDYVEEFINKELVSASWNSEGQTTSNLQEKWIYSIDPQTGMVIKKHNLLYKVTDIIGFAPNNSFSEGFDYKTYQLTSNTSAEFTKTLGDDFTQATGIEPSSAIPNGMLPREIGEFRSYYQLPFIYWNKLFQMFQMKAEEVTGYQFQLDDTWFTTSNPYWYNLVYMLRPLNNIKNTTYNNIYGSNYTSNLVVYYNSGKKYHYGFPADYEPGFSWEVQSEQIPILKQQGSYGQYFEMKDTEVIDGQLSVHFKVNVATNLGSAQNVHIRNNAVFVLDVYMTDAADGNPETFNERLGRICIKWSDSQYIAGYTTYTVNVGTKSIPAGSSTWTLVDQDFSFSIPADKYNKDIKFSYKLNGYHSETAFSGSLFVNTDPTSVDLGNITVYGTPNSMRLNVTPLTGKSFSKFTLNNLWNNEYNLFNEILKYCKMYRIGISVDEFNKKIVFKPYSKYFEDFSVKDWTKKIDKSKDYIITPVTLENKYLLFNYDDNKTKLGSDYKDKYGVNYGDYRLITEYNFNSETKKLFDKIKTSLVNTDSVLSWSNLYTYRQIVYSFPNELYVYNKDKDNKQVDIFGAFYFHNGIASFSDEEALHLRSVHISDDTVFQQVNNTYFYTQTADTTLTCNHYPLLDIVRGNNMCLFNIPQENYTYLNNYSGKSTIYNNFWEKYLNERYNIQNKKITCYVMLTPTEYNQFKWNKFVKIGNQLCIVNKIYDYDITSNQPTKVDLVTIQDINGYTTTNYNA